RISDELELDDRGCVAGTVADLHDPGVAGIPIPIFGRDLVDQFVDYQRLIRQRGDDAPAGGQRALFGKGYDVLDLAADLFGPRFGRLDLLVAQDGDYEVLVQRLTRAGLARQLAPADAVGHLRFLVVRFAQLVVVIAGGVGTLAERMTA